MVNFYKVILSGDIETNPGPFNNLAKTIHAPYSQGNTDIFGENAGHQCVPYEFTFPHLFVSQQFNM